MTGDIRWGCRGFTLGGHMQHYRGPTRLLDWTWSPFVAAYFAVKSKWKADPKHPTVWLALHFSPASG